MFAGYFKQYICCLHRTSVMSLHSSAVLLGVGKTMSKIIGTSSKKKNKYYNEPILPTPKHFAKGATEGKKSINSRRITVLNKLFMRYITDLMANGEYSNTLLKYSIEINRVQISPDFNRVNVFWLAKGLESDEIVEKLLMSHAGGLRHELSQLRVMGVVPHIHFVKDKKYAQIHEVDVRLSKADFGEDYVPDQSLTKLKTELQLHTTLEPHVKEKIQELDQMINEDLEDEIPEMTHNVFGVNHYDILERVKKSMKKSKAKHRTQDVDEEEEASTYKADELSSNVQPFSYGSAKKQREAFKEFLEKRRLLKLKYNREKNFGPEFEYIQEEWESHRQQLEETKFRHYFKDADFDDDVDYDDENINK